MVLRAEEMKNLNKVSIPRKDREKNQYLPPSPNKRWFTKMEIYIDDRVLQMTKRARDVLWLGHELSFPLNAYPVSRRTL